MRIRSRKSNLVSTSFLALGVFLVGMVCAPLLSAANAPSSTSVTIVNSSNSAIQHVYLSPADQDSWGADQLNSVIPSSGGSFTLSSVSCEASSIKVIAEDQEGCFLYKVVACSQATTWTISDSDARDCGN